MTEDNNLPEPRATREKIKRFFTAAGITVLRGDADQLEDLALDVRNLAAIVELLAADARLSEAAAEAAD